jgi:hypothetical protein
MNPEEAPAVLKPFLHARYYPQARLATWHLRGVLNDALADQLVEFIELQDRVAGMPFDRFTDFTGLTEIRLKAGHVFRLAEQLGKGHVGQPVKSAFYSDQTVGLGIARMYEELMRNAASYVRAFRDIGAAAQWLGVPLETLHFSP